jgi:uroporphyrinogen-III synthase
MSRLEGKRIIVTRAPEYAAGLRDALLAEGAIVEEVPMITYEPPDDPGIAAEALRRAVAFDYVIFTSATAVDGLCRIANQTGATNWAQGRATFVAVGEPTASAMRRAGLRVDAVGPGPGTTGLINLLADKPLQGKQVLLPRAQDGRDELRAWLAAQGATVTFAPVYRTVLAREAVKRLPGLLQTGIDVIAFTSPSTVGGFIATAGGGFERPAGMLVACIGPITAQAADEAGLSPDIISAEATAKALAVAIGDYFASHVFS